MAFKGITYKFICQNSFHHTKTNEKENKTMKTISVSKFNKIPNKRVMARFHFYSDINKKEVKAVENLFDCSQGTLHDITDLTLKNYILNSCIYTQKD
jgi:hypothetical protein